MLGTIYTGILLLLLHTVFFIEKVDGLSLWKPHLQFSASAPKGEGRNEVVTYDEWSSKPLGLTGEKLIKYFETNLDHLNIDLNGIPAKQLGRTYELERGPVTKDTANGTDNGDPPKNALLPRQKSPNPPEALDGREQEMSKLYSAFTNYLGVSAWWDRYDDRNLPNTCEPEISIVAKLTKDVPVQTKLHSHNDYWRKLPLFEALAYGISSIEADVWLYDNSTALAVGHNMGYLQAPLHDLRTLYLEPLMQMIDQVNCHMDIESPLYGAFYNSPEHTLLLYIDFKPADRLKTYMVLMEYLTPLIERGYLSYYDFTTKTLTTGPITIILTGNYPSDNEVMFPKNKRYTFLDAPLRKLKQLGDQYKTGSVSLAASASLTDLLSDCETSPTPNALAITSGATISSDLPWKDTQCLKEYITYAHELGLQTRIWGLPHWPIGLRDSIWQQLLGLGVDYLNVDDLASAVRF